MKQRMLANRVCKITKQKYYPGDETYWQVCDFFTGKVTCSLRMCRMNLN